MMHSMLYMSSSWCTSLETCRSDRLGHNYMQTCTDTVIGWVQKMQ